MKSIPSSGIVDVLFAPCSPVFPSLFDFYPHPSFTWYQPGMLYPRETPSKCELSRMLSISRFDPRRGSSTLFFTVRIRAGPVPRLSRCRAILSGYLGLTRTSRSLYSIVRNIQAGRRGFTALERRPAAAMPHIEIPPLTMEVEAEMSSQTPYPGS